MCIQYPLCNILFCGFKVLGMVFYTVYHFLLFFLPMSNFYFSFFFSRLIQKYCWIIDYCAVVLQKNINHKFFNNITVIVIICVFFLLGKGLIFLFVVFWRWICTTKFNCCIFLDNSTIILIEYTCCIFQSCYCINPFVPLH